MRKTRTGDGTGFFLLGAIAGAAVALLMAPAQVHVLGGDCFARAKRLRITS